jgi:hypothetical protein
VRHGVESGATWPPLPEMSSLNHGVSFTEAWVNFAQMILFIQETLIMNEQHTCQMVQRDTAKSLYIRPGISYLQSVKKLRGKTAFSRVRICS